MEFLPGLTVVDSVAVGDIIETARGADLAVFVILTGGREGREAFFDTVRATLPLDPPLQSSRSWDALSDSLWEGLIQLDSDGIVIAWSDAADFKDVSPTEYETALAVLGDVVESIGDSVGTCGRPKMVSVYVGGRRGS
ncbi:barstar family protein [Micromonospora sp. DT229]|uniref:barstar family protein n=1 Tax=Micromonospora sp. DT229 TaxID=3393430 RepID=UPI003CE8DE16